MANVTINDFVDLGSGVAAGDYIPVWDASAGATRKVTRAILVGGVLTGGGTVETGGYTLTVPGTGTAALRGALNTFTVKQTFAPPAGDAAIDCTGGDLGTNGGRHIILGRNNNASTPAAGHIRMARRSGTVQFIWADNAGDLRIHNGEPVYASDGAGTVIGTQTSSLDAKRLVGGESSIDDVLDAVRAGAQAVRRFVYKSGSFGGEEFEGVVVDFAPRYGMDRDGEHPAGKSLNEIRVIGDLLRAVAYLADRVAALEGRGHGD